MDKDRKLTAKQELFCIELLKDLNQTQAAIRAGYSKKGARTMGAKLVANDNIQNYIGKLKEKRNKRLEVTQDEVLNHLNILRKAKIDDYVVLTTVPTDPLAAAEIDNNMELSDEERIEAKKGLKYTQTMFFKDFDDLTEEQLMCIESVKMGTNGLELKLHGKEWTIEKINRHIGFYEVDNTQKQSSIVVVPPKRD